MIHMQCNKTVLNKWQLTFCKPMRHTIQSCTFTMHSSLSSDVSPSDSSSGRSLPPGLLSDVARFSCSIHSCSTSSNSFCRSSKIKNYYIRSLHTLMQMTAKNENIFQHHPPPSAPTQKKIYIYILNFQLMFWKQKT